MNEHLRERILRKLEALSDDRGYQVLDFVEFMESRYAERQTPGATPFTRFAEAVEDRLRAGKVSATTIAEAMNLMNKAANVLNGALAAGRSVANDIVTAARTPAAGSPATPAASGAARPSGNSSAAGEGSAATSASQPINGAASTPSDASSTAHDTKQPGSGEEKL
jgi:hypothetical protein